MAPPERPPAGRPRRSRTTTPAPGPERAVHVLPSRAGPVEAPVSDLPVAPVDLGEHGRALWAAVVEAYELERHELELLEQAVRTADLVEALRVALADGELLTAEGKIRPEIVELRQQRQMLARLITALRVPLGAEAEEPTPGARPQRRGGVRGVYRPRGVS